MHCTFLCGTYFGPTIPIHAIKFLTFMKNVLKHYSCITHGKTLTKSHILEKTLIVSYYLGSSRKIMYLPFYKVIINLILKTNNNVIIIRRNDVLTANYLLRKLSIRLKILKSFF